MEIYQYAQKNYKFFDIGCKAIEKRYTDKLIKVIKSDEFNYNNALGRALLFYAAEHTNLEAFSVLGTAGVPLYRNQKELKSRPHLLSGAHPLIDNVTLIADTTPLHTLMKNLNVVSFEDIDLSVFNPKDVNRAINAFSVADNGTPLDIGFEQNAKACDEIIKYAIENKQEFLELPCGYADFCRQTFAYYPDLTAPEIGGQRMLFHRALQINDTQTFVTIMDLSIFLLERIGYHFSSTEYQLLKDLDVDKEVLSQLIVDDKVPSPVKEKPYTRVSSYRPSVFQRIKTLFCHNRN